MPERRRLEEQIHSDIYDALRTVEENEISDLPRGRLERVAELARELSQTLNDLCHCQHVKDG